MYVPSVCVFNPFMSGNVSSLVRSCPIRSYIVACQICFISAFSTCFSPNNVQNMNRITCLIHSVLVGSPGPPNLADSVTFPVGIATPAALLAP